MAKKKAALPKSIAGFKVPKSLRKNRLLQSLIASPFGRKVLADAIVAGAGAAATVLVREREEAIDATRTGLRKGGRSIAIMGEAGESAVHAMMDVVTDAARSMLPKDKRRKQKGRSTEADTRH
jgi:hypothetical protein